MLESITAQMHLMLWSPLSSLKLARIAALSFCTTDLSSAIVFEARTLRMNCFTVHEISSSSLRLDGEVNLQELMAASWTPIRGDGVIELNYYGLDVTINHVVRRCHSPGANNAS